MDSIKNELKIYQYIQTKCLPEQVVNYLAKYFTPVEMPIVTTELFKSLEEICDKGFRILDLTAEDINFKHPQTFVMFQQKAVEILNTNFTLFNNELVDEAIFKIVTEENDLDYHEELIKCRDRLNELIIVLDFDDEYERARGLKSKNEIELLINDLKEDIFRIDIKCRNLWLFADNHRSMYKKQSETLIGFLQLKKNQLAEKETGKINPIIEVSLCLALQKAFADEIWKSNIGSDDFLKYWTFGGMGLPFEHNLINKNYFVFLLHELGLLSGKSESGHTQEQIAGLFGISNIAKLKSDVIRRQQITSHYQFIKDQLNAICRSRKK